MLDSFPKTFTASVETREGVSFQYPFHLGTQEPMARTCVEEILHRRLSADLPVLTVALIFDGNIVDVYDGKDWVNEHLAKLDAELMEEWA